MCSRIQTIPVESFHVYKNCCNGDGSWHSSCKVKYLLLYISKLLFLFPPFNFQNTNFNLFTGLSLLRRACQCQWVDVCMGVLVMFLRHQENVGVSLVRLITLRVIEDLLHLTVQLNPPVTHLSSMYFSFF